MSFLSIVAGGLRQSGTAFLALIEIVSSFPREGRRRRDVLVVFLLIKGAVRVFFSLLF